MIPIKDTIPRSHPPVATLMIIVVNAAVFLFELMLPQDALQRFFYLFGIVPARFTHPDWASWVGLPIDDYWPFLTSMFLHGGWLHILGNMWILWIFGDNVEDRMGPWRYTIFYLLCGLVAGYVHCLTNADSKLPTVGASGAIAGVMGAYFVLFPTSRVVVLLPVLFYPLFFEVPAVVYLGIWVLMQFFSGTLSLAGGQQVGGVAFWAHVGGFVAGIVLQLVFVRRGGAWRPPSRDEYHIEGAWLPDGHWRESR
jgi:rhomboid family protein